MAPANSVMAGRKYVPPRLSLGARLARLMFGESPAKIAARNAMIEIQEAKRAARRAKIDERINRHKRRPV